MATPTAPSNTQRWSEMAAALSAGINRWVERLCAAILAVLIVDIWIGIFGRYVFELPVTWAEELARYLMIWAALLAVSCGVARREHVAVTMLLHRFPPGIRRWFDVAIDALAFAFFAFLFYFGIDMTEQGATQYATIFGMTMMIPFASVPVSAALVSVQLVLMALRDFSVAGLPGEFAVDE
ncbi:MAG TPA: C4-dicarboxylate ABC transporter permease [Rhodocyclaceae bacterium]|nr:MAG: C4-dicarboxylate ABC transporter permease [Rhodocyclales bacterium CG_4_10_14_3_um_filter_68_10]PJA58732.1 MAG: C4-dicarboxylate ABC transporter permease [Rhodocyclales bacterium CG_4_9_14_3_um_filter_68_10]HCX34187.1 C4-dicarboxylate ABC transporter permease [Rhodocyclaceae bacterium]